MATSRAETQAVTRERLLDAALQLFSQRRASDVSLDEVARVAGFTKGAVYANFASKSDLLLSVYERRMREQGRDYIDVLGGSPDASLAADTGARAGRTQAGDLDYFRLFCAVWAEAVHDPDLARRFGAVRRESRQRLAQAIRQRAADHGLTLHVDVDALATGLLGMSMATMMEALIDPDLDVAEVHAAVTATVLGGIIAASET